MIEYKVPQTNASKLHKNHTKCIETLGTKRERKGL